MLYFKNLLSGGEGRLLTFTALGLLLLSGCQGGDATKSQDGAAQKTSRPQAASPVEPQVKIYVDEPMLAKPYAVIGGAVENGGGRRLEGLTVEIELRRRADGSVERRDLQVEPAALDPGQRGKFSLKVLSSEWSGSRVVSLRSGAGQDEVAFKSLPGAKRPPERIKENIVIAKPPAKKKGDGSDFINTPDNPYSVP